MKLIIDIPDMTYEATLERGQLAICNDNDIYKWIKNGIPLDDIRADIEQSRYGLVNDGLDLALKIIDKHVAKAEGEEG